MRIGIFTECYSPITNGVVVSVESFRQELLALGHEVWLFTPDYQKYTDPHIIPLRSLRLPTQTVYRAATPFMRRRPPPQLDIIHTHSSFSTGLLALSQGRHYNCPVVFTYHTRLEDYAHYVPLPTPLARRAMVWASRYFCNRTDMVLTPTSEIYRLLKSYGVDRPIEVLATGTHLDGLERADAGYVRRRFNVAPDRRVLLTVGRLAPEKNLPFLLDAFHLAHLEHPNTVLIVVGDGPDKPQLEDQVRHLGLEGAVHFAGMIDRSHIAHYYRAAELFVFASVTETQGLVVGESLEAGTPVIAVAAGGIIDALRGVPGGILCEPTPQSLGRTIARVLGDQSELLRLRRGAESRLGVVPPQQSGHDLLDLYRRVIEGFHSGLPARPKSPLLPLTGRS